MTEREMLIELLKIPYEVCKNTNCQNCEHNTEYYCFLNRFATSLLDNGVIVPPAKVTEIPETDVEVRGYKDEK